MTTSSADAPTDAGGEGRRGERPPAVRGHVPDAGDERRHGAVRLAHASFFSGAGGLDIGLERSGWETVSFSEIDPYASAVLAQRWPSVPNLGDITELAHGLGEQRGERDASRGSGVPAGEPHLHEPERPDWRHAALWSGGFPCQDLSVAGKRRGLAGDRSGLAFAFLALVERHRPPLVLLENVPGLLSSHGGRDMAALIGALVDLGYGVAWRVLDARHFGVPQRRRRVFIVGVKAGGRAGAERAAEVLSVGSRCRRHPPAGIEAGEEPAARAGVGADETVGALPAGVHGFPDGVQEFMQGHFRVQHPSPDPSGNGKTHGIPGRLDDRGGVAYVKGKRAQSVHDDESWRADDVSPTLNAFDVGDTRATTLIPATDPHDDPLLPLGLDSHRYRCCGNGVVSNVAEWLGWRLREALEAA